MQINVGDKFIATKNSWFVKIGDVVEVLNVNDSDGVIRFLFDEDSCSTGYMDRDSFLASFEYLESEEIEEETGEEKLQVSVTYDDVAEIMDNCEFESYSVFGRQVVVSCKLPNGYVITESFGGVNSEDYDQDVFIDVCFDKIADRIFELETYRVREEMYRAGLNAEELMECECCCCECCDECCEEEDEETEESSCDNCMDYTCLNYFNKNNKSYKN